MDDATKQSSSAPGGGGKDAKAPDSASDPKSAPPKNKPKPAPRPKVSIPNGLVPVLMRMAIAPSQAIDALNVRDYRDQIFREMGNPVDPLERMLIEQATVAHLMIMQMHGLTTAAKTAEVTALYAGATARLMAELRRTILSVREYRAPMTRPVVTTIEQQNIAHTQAVSYVAGPAGTHDAVMACREKIGADGGLISEVEDGQSEINEIAGARGRWSEEPEVARSTDG